MQERDRLWATVVIWSAVTLIMVAIIAALTISQPELSFEITAMIGMIMLVLIGAAGYSTSHIWRGANAQARHGDQVRDQMRKVKRLDPARLQRLVEKLDEDEIIELETLLMSRQDDVL